MAQNSWYHGRAIEETPPRASSAQSEVGLEIKGMQKGAPSLWVEKIQAKKDAHAPSFVDGMTVSVCSWHPQGTG